jgi:hypothetical protein
MRSISLHVALALMSLPLAGCGTENQPVTSEEQACDVLERTALQWCLSRTNLAGRYWCDAVPESPDHFVLALRYYPKPEELVGSTLIGWYAVSRADGAVSNWDVTSGELTPLVSGCPFEAE